jgi:hypothetical protein
LEKRGDGYVYSEGSVNAVGKIMSLVTIDGEHILKNKMIGLLADKKAIKNGNANINKVSTIAASDSSELMYFPVDSHFFGIQLDAFHISDDSMIKEISQVISALSQNQATPEIYSELYSAIGELVRMEMKKYEKKFKLENGNFNIPAITSAFLESLLSTNQYTNAVEISNLFREGLRKRNVKELPLSNKNLFNGFVIDIISKLSSSFITRKYPGLGAVLHPSYNSIMLYEDKDGNTMFAEDFNMPFSNDINIPISVRRSQALEQFLPDILKSEEITIDKVSPLDRIIYNGEELNLENIADYYSFKEYLFQSQMESPDAIKVTKVHNKPRNLKPQETIFKVGEQSFNAFDFDPVRIMYRYKNNLLTVKDITILNNFLTSRGKITNIVYSLENTKLVLDQLQLWLKRVKELASLGYLVPKATIEENYFDIFNADDFVSKLDLTNYNLENL